eukprot:jgi/Undpi1/803/HiC_scaffold_10.g04267.m1
MHSEGRRKEGVVKGRREEEGVEVVANHLGSSRLEENLNDFFELHSEELRNDLSRRRRGSLGSAGAGGEEDPENNSIKTANANDGEFSLRIHELYQEFLHVVQANLEEFLHAEGLTEAELRDACEKEMQVEDPGGLSFMHTLISSWEFSSFVELASDFVDEEIDAEESDDADGKDWEGEEEEEGEDNDAQESPLLSSSGAPRVGAVTIDTVAGGEEGEGTRKTPLGDGDVVGIADSTDSRAVGENQWPEYRTRPSRYAENKSRTSGSNGGGDDSVIHSGAVRCCVKNCAGLVAVESQPESDRVGAKARRLGRTRRGVRQEEEEEGEGLVEELSMRAEAKC